MTNTKFAQEAVLCGFPSHMIDGLWLYITQGIEPGGFMMAVLENNLMEACGRADVVNRDRLFQICSFLYNYTPHECHGSREKVVAWIEARRAEVRG